MGGSLRLWGLPHEPAPPASDRKLIERHAEVQHHGDTHDARRMLIVSNVTGRTRGADLGANAASCARCAEDIHISNVAMRANLVDGTSLLAIVASLGSYAHDAGPNIFADVATRASGTDANDPESARAVEFARDPSTVNTPPADAGDAQSAAESS